MPQMAPSLWTFYLLIMLLVYFVSISLNYFNFSSNNISYFFYPKFLFFFSWN